LCGIVSSQFAAGLDEIFTLDQYCQSGILTSKADPLIRLRRTKTSPVSWPDCRMPISSAQAIEHGYVSHRAQVHVVLDGALE
jgi:hypothetical protein